MDNKVYVLVVIDSSNRKKKIQWGEGENLQRGTEIGFYSGNTFFARDGLYSGEKTHFQGECNSKSTQMCTPSKMFVDPHFANPESPLLFL
jgi:hypothetical protein